MANFQTHSSPPLRQTMCRTMTSPTENSLKSTLIQLIHDGMGDADADLQHTLMRKYLVLLQQNNSLPGAICFYTSGVKMVVEGSPVLDVLQALESQGVRLIVCKTCLDYYGLLEKVRVGIVGGMPDIIAAQMLADKVITL